MNSHIIYFGRKMKKKSIIFLIEKKEEKKSTLSRALRHVATVKVNLHILTFWSLTTGGLKGILVLKNPADKYAGPGQSVSKHILVKALLFEVLFSLKEKIITYIATDKVHFSSEKC